MNKCDGWLGVGFKPSSLGNHGSSHTFVDLPLPTWRQAPHPISFLAFSMAFHTCEALWNCKLDNCGIYLGKNRKINKTKKDGRYGQ